MQLELFTFEILGTTEIGATDVLPLFYTGPRALYTFNHSISLFIVELPL